MGEARIRPYEPGDLDEALSVWEAASREGHPFLPESFIEAERGQVRDVHLPAATTWVYELEGRVAGFIALVGDQVGGLFVDPAHHRRGIGRSLMAFAMDRYTDLELEVFEENAGARAFYARCGFRNVSTSVHEETGRPVVRMACRAGGGDR